jgi:hypothetical protein
MLRVLTEVSGSHAEAIECTLGGRNVPPVTLRHIVLFYFMLCYAMPCDVIVACV